MIVVTVDNETFLTTGKENLKFIAEVVKEKSGEENILVVPNAIGIHQYTAKEGINWLKDIRVMIDAFIEKVERENEETGNN